MKPIYKVKCTNKHNNKEVNCDLEGLLKQVKKNPFLLQGHNFEVTIDTKKQFTAKAWVHPEAGGDDYQMKITVCAQDVEEAKKLIEEALKEEGSCIINDYQLV